MRRKAVAVVLLALLTLFALTLPATADSAPLASAAVGLRPVDSTTVRMESENIEIRVHRAADEPGRLPMAMTADVTVHFHFVPVADENLRAGFPLNSSDWHRSLEVHPTSFTVVADGQPLPYEQQDVAYAGGTTPWAVWTLAFHKGKPLDLDVRYQMDVSPYGKSWSSDLYLFYLLQTGRYWAGSIGKAEAVVRFDRPIQASDIRSQTTKGWSLTKDGALTWTWTDLKPDFDVQLMLANAYWLDLPAEAAVLAQKPTLTRAEQLLLIDMMYRLWTGTGRDPSWEPVRGGKLSGEVANALWPAVEKALAPALAADPHDRELHDRYLAMLEASSFTFGPPDGRMSLVSPERLRLYLAALEKDPKALPAYPVSWCWQWLADYTYKTTTDAAARRQDLQALVRSSYPERFESDAEARQFVTSLLHPQGGMVVPAPTADFERDALQAALARVQQGAAPALAPAPGRDAAATGADATAATAPAAPRTTRPPWRALSARTLALLGLGIGVALGAAALIVLALRRRK